MNTPTPETDAAWQKHLDDDFSDGSDPWELASRLERERDEASTKLAQCQMHAARMAETIDSIRAELIQTTS